MARKFAQERGHLLGESSFREDGDTLYYVAKCQFCEETLICQTTDSPFKMIAVGEATEPCSIER